MKLTEAEIEFLSAWAREEWESECYGRPAHRLQLAHGVSGAHTIGLIKAWTKAEAKKTRIFSMRPIIPPRPGLGRVARN